MDVRSFADRLLLRRCHEHHPEWTLDEYATATRRSRSWVKTWLGRSRESDPTDISVLLDRPRSRHTPNPTIAPLVVERILAIRDTPPANLQRVPGPKTIAYFLAQDPELQASGCPTPVPSTIWRVLRQHQRILPPGERHHQPVPRPAPLSSWQLDYKDAGLPATDPEGKQQHVVEVLNAVDVGTSIWVAEQARPDYTMATTIAAVAEMFQRHGVPEQINVDRDPRFVGSQLPRDTPSAFLRFVVACGVKATISPPHCPQTNGFVERFHRTLGEECLGRQRPADLESLTTLLAQFHEHYNAERPHQGLSCGNQPPLLAFPELPALPRPAAQLDLDRWVSVLHGHCYTRTVHANGTVQFDQRPYYVGRHLAGRTVDLIVDGPARELVVQLDQQAIKRLPLKGLVGKELPFDEAVAHAMQDARRYDRQRRLRQVRMW